MLSLSPFEGSPRAGAAEYVQGGMLSLQTVTSPRPIDRHLSPFEGSPRAGAAEYVQGGDVNCQIVKSPNRQIAKSPNRQIC